ncbi:hypothetical protein [Winogradskyella sp.]|uniref:hypothetical protein n=1 Tax=Winogradskyella sp. TaxID=1883156 RepID=UPI003BA99949
MNYKTHIYSLGLLFFFIQFGFSQTSVMEVLEMSLKTSEQFSTFSCNLDYKYFPTYVSEEHTANYKGVLIKDELDSFLKIKETIFLTNHNSKTVLKVNKLQKAMSISNNLDMPSNMDYLSNLRDIISQFDAKELTETTTTWKCILVAPEISQLPYSKVELYINKSDNMITKQVLYISAQFPYNDEDGRQMANPRLEISVTDHKTLIEPEQKKLLDLDNYIHKKNGKIVPVKAYKNYQIL